MEIRQSQWRGGVWEDPETHVCWLVVCGRAKGGHQDRDDFYKRIEREDQAGDPTQWLPTEVDKRLLKQETSARIRTKWELETQQLVLDVLRDIRAGGVRSVEVPHPVPDQGLFATITVTVEAVREPNYEADELVVEVVPEPKYAGSALCWQLTVRALLSIEPPEQGWDRFGDTYSNIGEPGAWERRVDALAALVRAGVLAESVPRSTSHYAHREHLAGRTISGEAVRALCGTFFVPRQDPDPLPPCSTCKQRLAEICAEPPA